MHGQLIFEDFKDVINEALSFSLAKSNGVLKFEYGIPVVRTFKNFMSFVDPKRGTFNEVEY